MNTERAIEVLTWIKDKLIISAEYKKALDMAIKALSTERTGEWIPCSERLPECEQEVLICTEKKILGKDACIDSIITPAMYEDGTMLEIESKWRWDDMDFDGWDDMEDCGIIPEGWWENRHFNPDEVYNNPVDRNVIAWQPLPDPYNKSDNYTLDTDYEDGCEDWEERKVKLTV